MRRSDEEPEDQLLFDLPLDRPLDRPVVAPARTETRRTTAAPRARPAPAPPAPITAPREDDEAGLHGEEAEETETTARAGLGSRLAAGAADLLVHAAVLMILLIGTRLLGVRATLSDAPALALFLLTFSFLYTIVPLAFWGHTLGMAWTGLVAQNRDGEPLTFDQTARRWLGAVLTLAAVGLPLLLALGGRSLADLLSGSVTWSDRVGDEAEPEAA